MRKSELERKRKQRCREQKSDVRRWLQRIRLGVGGLASGSRVETLYSAKMRVRPNPSYAREIAPANRKARKLLIRIPRWAHLFRTDIYTFIHLQRRDQGRMEYCSEIEHLKTETPLRPFSKLFIAQEHASKTFHFIFSNVLSLLNYTLRVKYPVTKYQGKSTHKSINRARLTIWTKILF